MHAQHRTATAQKLLHLEIALALLGLKWLHSTSKSVFLFNNNGNCSEMAQLPVL